MRDRERIFLEKYFSSGCNACEAYRASHPDASPGTVRKASHTYLNRPVVQEALKEWREAMNVDTETAWTAVNRHLLDRIFCDISDFGELAFGPEGKIFKIKELNEIPENKRKLIRGIKATPSGLELQLESRDRALELYCKLNGLLQPDKINLNVETSQKFADIISQLGGPGLEEEENEEEKEGKKE